MWPGLSHWAPRDPEGRDTRAARWHLALRPGAASQRPRKPRRPPTPWKTPLASATRRQCRPLWTLGQCLFSCHRLTRSVGSGAPCLRGSGAPGPSRRPGGDHRPGGERCAGDSGLRRAHSPRLQSPGERAAPVWKASGFRVKSTPTPASSSSPTDPRARRAGSEAGVLDLRFLPSREATAALPQAACVMGEHSSYRPWWPINQMMSPLTHECLKEREGHCF